MGVVVRCPNPNCRTAYKVADECLGGRAKCKKCGATITLQISREETISPAHASAAKSSPSVSIGQERAGAQSSADSTSQLSAAADLSQSLSDREPLPTITPYVCQRMLGRGGMGVVYLAFDPRLERKVAIKLLPPDLAQDKVRVERFLREARMAAKVQHANTVVIHEVDVRDGKAFLVMEFVDGQSLDKAISGGKPMDWREATKAIRDAAAGLAAAHDLGVVHRDVKPANLMRTRNGHTKVVDFGLARAIQSDTQLTQEGFLLGTPAYMAPELWTGREADASTDLYALICSYFHLLTGRAPYDAPSVPALGYQHRYEPFPDARSLAPRLPEAVCRILARGAQKEPTERYASAAELLKDLDSVLAYSQGSSPEESWRDNLDAELGPIAAASETESVALNTISRRGLAHFAESSEQNVPVPLSAPPWYRRPRSWAIAAGAALPLFLLAVVLHVTTNYGTIKIELSDPAAKVDVQVDGNTIDIGGLKDPLRIKSGPHDLTVTSGDFQTVTKSFEVKRGSVEILKVSLLPKTDAGAAQQPATASTRPSAKNVATSSPKPAQPEQNLAARAAAEKIFQLGGWCWANTNGVNREIHDSRKLPKDLSDIWLVTFDTDAARKVTDADLVNLSALTGLKELYLKLTQVTGEGFNHLAQCRALWKLYLDQTKLNDRGLAQVGKLPSIRVLNCDKTQVTDAGLDHLQNLPLETLELRSTSVTDAGLVHLEKMPLKSLDLLSTKITDAGVPHIIRIQTLESLVLDSNRISDAGVKDLSKLPRLRALFLNSTQVSDACLSVLPSQLEHFHVGYSHVTGQGLQGIGRFSALKNLGLVGNKINDGLHFLPNCPLLETLIVQESDITDAGLATLADCRRLTWLDANRTALRGRGIGKLQNIERLNVYQTNIDKTSVDEIATLGKLRWLDLGNNKLVDAELASIGRLETLTELLLTNNNLTDAILPELAKLVRLKNLDLSNNPKITAAAVDKLRSELKQCNIIFSPSQAASAAQQPATDATKVPPPAPEFQKLVSKVGDTWTNSMGMKFAYIAPGEFFMGAPEKEPDRPRTRSETLHKVRITKPYLMGVYEVTRGQFAKFVDEVGYKTEAEKPMGAGVSGPEHMGPKVPGANWRQPGFPQDDHHPVVCVSWNAAMTYATWLSRKEGIKYRLPTEAEWEFACRAGTQSAYHWGADPNRGKLFANCADQSTVRAYKQINAAYWDDGFPFTAPVGSFKPNARGLFDMSGNVSEWCLDFGGDLPAEMQVDPQGPDQSIPPIPQNCHVYRGGNWGIPPLECRSAGRGIYYGGPEYSGTGVGFRLVVELQAAVQAASPGPRPLTAADEAAADPEFAKLLQQAASGDPGALWGAGRHYLKQHDFAEALKWFKKGADAGQPSAMRDIGQIYNSGLGVEVNHAEALKWYRRGAQGGDLLAMAELGGLYEKGAAVKQDYREAIRWYRKASTGGDPLSMWRLSDMYRDGHGVRQDDAEAFRWLRKSAETGGYPATYFKLAQLYEEGIGTKKNVEEALKWYAKAAESGNTEAMRLIGDSYEDGRGVAKDADQAATWYRKAAATGDKQASEWLAAHKLSP